MIEVHRNTSKLDFIIEYNDKTGAILVQNILKGKTNVVYKKTMLEMLLSTGLLPKQNINLAVTVMDNSLPGFKMLQINCQFLNVQDKQKALATNLISEIYDPAGLFLDLELSPEFCLDKFNAKLEQVKKQESFYLNIIDDVIIVQYKV